MLRRWTAVFQIFILFLSILFSALAPTNSFAEGNPIVIYQLQTGASAAATQEYISLFNNSDQPTDISGWCVTYASSSDSSQTQLGCFNPPNSNTKLLLPGHATASLATTEFAAAHPGFAPDIVFSTGISGTSGHIRILDIAKNEMDKLAWGTAIHPETTSATAHAAGKILQRISLPSGLLQDTDVNAADFLQTTLNQLTATSIEEEAVPVDVCPNIDDFQLDLPSGFLPDNFGNCIQDQCANLPNLQASVPDGYIAGNAWDCTVAPLESATIKITELLPNVSGSDTGKEFIELFNPNDHDISLKGYELQTGANYGNHYILPDVLITSMHYLALSDVETGIVLPNTLGMLRLMAPSGDIVSTISNYEDPGDDRSWSLFNDSWFFTDTPTPNAQNILSTDSTCGDCEVVSDEPENNLVPCRADQERNPETNRCRLLQTPIAGLQSCKLGQERNPDTNRCRSITTDDSNSLVPCKVGQERNPESNRCRTVAQAAAIGACDEGQERNPETNRCRKSASGTGAGSQLAKVQDVSSGSIAKSPRWWVIIVAVVGAIGYAAFEWRNEAMNFIRKYVVKKQH